MLRVFAVGVSVGSSACGTLGIDLGGSSDMLDGWAGSAPDATGGKSSTHPASGGNDMGSGSGPGSGGQSSGGETHSGGESASGGTDGEGGTGGGSGGDAAGGGSATGGSSGDGGSGGSGDCDVGDDTCPALASALVHRYSFNGIGPAIIDSVGGKNGNALGTALNGSGELAFSDGDHVTLPPGLVSPLPDATIEVWFEWDGGEQWQWLFSFGHKMGPLGSPTSYLYATPEAGGSIEEQNALAAGIRHEGEGDRQLRTTVLTAPGMLTHVALVVSDTADRLSLYKNGEWIADRDTEVDLSGINDDTNRLGLSLFTDDPPFEGRITEFRIYGEALTAEMIGKSYDLGPDATLEP